MIGLIKIIRPSTFNYFSQSIYKSFYQFKNVKNTIMDTFNNSGKRTEEQFKRQIESLANKPTFTLLDYKQRIIDQLNKIRKGFAAKLSKANQETEQTLQIQRKILCAFYDEELLEEVPLKGHHKVEISMVTQIDITKIRQLLNKYKYYVNLHAVLRSAKEQGRPLPKDPQELQYMYQTRGFSITDQKTQQKLKYKKRSRAQKIRYIKFNY